MCGESTVTEIKKPDQPTLDYIANNYKYVPNGTINGPLTDNVGEFIKTGTRLFCRIKIKGRNFRRYHIVWFLNKGEWPKSQLDHKDRDSTNDKIDNLVECDDFKQQQNRGNYTGYREFSIEPKNDGKWRYRNYVVRNKAKGIRLGYAKDREEAIIMIDGYYEGGGGNSKI